MSTQRFDETATLSRTRTPRKQRSNGDINKLDPTDRAAHDWYRFVLSYPPHLVRDYLEKFRVTPQKRILDPFCGTGTTIVECKKLGIPSVGVEANPIARFASEVKADWSIDADALLKHADAIAKHATMILAQQGITDHPEEEGTLFSTRTRRDGSIQLLHSLPPEKLKLLLTDSISPLPLHKSLVLIDRLTAAKRSPCWRHEILALAKALVFTISNLHFGPEVGVAPPKKDAPVVAAWLHEVRQIAVDLRSLGTKDATPARVYHADSRQLSKILEPHSVDAVITSPPYPNEKDYTRTTRLESVLLGFIEDKADIRALKKGLVRSNTRSVYVDDNDDGWVTGHAEIQRIAKAIEARRIELGKTSGFERMYHRVTKLYFGGMARHFADMRNVLRPGAMLAYVVGDQASYLRIMIRTGKLLGEIAQGLGYELIGFDLFRTRLSTATREQLREEVVVLRWPG